MVLLFALRYFISGLLSLFEVRNHVVVRKGFHLKDDDLV